MEGRLKPVHLAARAAGSTGSWKTASHLQVRGPHSKAECSAPEGIWGENVKPMPSLRLSNKGKQFGMSLSFLVAPPFPLVSPQALPAC